MHMIWDIFYFQGFVRLGEMNKCMQIVLLLVFQHPARISAISWLMLIRLFRQASRCCGSAILEAPGLRRYATMGTLTDGGILLDAGKGIRSSWKAYPQPVKLHITVGRTEDRHPMHHRLWSAETTG
jgi:hypothetical protein